MLFTAPIKGRAIIMKVNSLIIRAFSSFVTWLILNIVHSYFSVLIVNMAPRKSKKAEDPIVGPNNSGVTKIKRATPVGKSQAEAAYKSIFGPTETDELASAPSPAKSDPPKFSPRKITKGWAELDFNVVQQIATLLSSTDLCSFRFSCRWFNDHLQYDFRREFLPKLHVGLFPDSLLRLHRLSRDPALNHFVREIVIGLDWINTPTEAQLVGRNQAAISSIHAFKANEEVFAKGVWVSALEAALQSLPNLRIIRVRDSLGELRPRDQTPWRSQGVKQLAMAIWGPLSDVSQTHLQIPPQGVALKRAEFWGHLFLIIGRQNLQIEEVDGKLTHAHNGLTLNSINELDRRRKQIAAALARIKRLSLGCDPIQYLAKDCHGVANEDQDNQCILVRQTFVRFFKFFPGLQELSLNFYADLTERAAHRLWEDYPNSYPEDKISPFIMGSLRVFVHRPLRKLELKRVALNGHQQLAYLLSNCCCDLTHLKMVEVGINNDTSWAQLMFHGVQRIARLEELQMVDCRAGDYRRMRYRLSENRAIVPLAPPGSATRNYFLCFPFSCRAAWKRSAIGVSPAIQMQEDVVCIKRFKLSGLRMVPPLRIDGIFANETQLDWNQVVTKYENYTGWEDADWENDAKSTASVEQELLEELQADIARKHAGTRRQIATRERRTTRP
jgi:hypothetical protein